LRSGAVVFSAAGLAAEEAGDRRAKNIKKILRRRDIAGCGGMWPDRPPATSNKPQAKSKKGAHLSAGPSPAWRDRDFACGLPAAEAASRPQIGSSFVPTSATIASLIQTAEYPLSRRAGDGLDGLDGFIFWGGKWPVVSGLRHSAGSTQSETRSQKSEARSQKPVPPWRCSVFRLLTSDF
jgi:hypothetical protein